MRILFGVIYMNKTNRIRLFFIAGTGILIGGYTLWQAYPQKQKSPETQISEEKDDEETTKVDKEQQPYEYVVVNEDGYLCVYLKDLKTVYFQTDIPYQELNTEMKQQIDQGYFIKDTAELYDFLENYSS